MSSNSPFNESRFKILKLDYRYILEVFNWWKNPPYCFQLPATDLPSDCTVVEVSIDHSTRTFDLCLCSSEFPVVEAGFAIPAIYPDYATFQTPKEITWMPQPVNVPSIDRAEDAQ